MTPTHTQPAGCDLDSLRQRTGEQLYQSWQHQQANRMSLAPWAQLSDQQRAEWNAEAAADNAAARAAQAPQGDTRQGAADDRISAYKLGSWFDALTIDEMQAFYMSRLPAIREAAQEHGYAIGLHGSTRRDFDLMAMQWREGASDKDTLARAIADAACGIRREGAYDWEKKPNGRVATSIPVCWTSHENPDFDNMVSAGHIDLSVIDIATPSAHTCTPADERALYEAWELSEAERFKGEPLSTEEAQYVLKRWTRDPETYERCPHHWPAFQAGLRARAAQGAGTAPVGHTAHEYSEAVAHEAWNVVCRNLRGLSDSAQAAIRDALLAPLYATHPAPVSTAAATTASAIKGENS